MGMYSCPCPRAPPTPIPAEDRSGFPVASRRAAMTIDLCSDDDYQDILRDLSAFWDERADQLRPFHHPIFVHEFGNSAFVMRDAFPGGDQHLIAAYLLGLISQREPVAYVHMIAVRGAYRRRGLARQLYGHFIEFARSRRCRWLKAIASPTNADSIAFHRSLGMDLLGEINETGVPVLRNYAGPGQDRVVFFKDIR